MLQRGHVYFDLSTRQLHNERIAMYIIVMEYTMLAIPHIIIYFSATYMLQNNWISLNGTDLSGAFTTGSSPPWLEVAILRLALK